MILTSLMVPQCSNLFSRSFSLVPFGNPLIQICGYQDILNIIQNLYNFGILRKIAMGIVPATTNQKAFQINQEKFSYLKDSLCLDNQNIQSLYHSFLEIDQQQRSFFDIDDFIAYFRRDLDNFVELPYAQRLFRCIPKANTNKVFFEEFVKGISAFCLLNNEGLLHFIFDYIDLDGDERISKRDIEKVIEYQDPVNGDYSFFINFKPDLDRFPMKQNQTKIDFDYFRLNYEKLTFLVWPAFSLQEFLRTKNIGIQFWFDLYAKVEKKENEIKSNEKKQLRIKEKLEVLKNMKTRKNSKCFIKEKINQRKPKEVNDDCKLLKRNRRARRKSAGYLKPELTIESLEFDEGKEKKEQ